MMKKTAKVWAYGLMAAMLLAGCSGKTQDESAAAGSSAEAVTDASGTTVVLGTYKGVTYTPMSTEITDEQVEAETVGIAEHVAEQEDAHDAELYGDTSDTEGQLGSGEELGNGEDWKYDDFIGIIDSGSSWSACF